MYSYFVYSLKISLSNVCKISDGIIFKHNAFDFYMLQNIYMFENVMAFTINVYPYTSIYFTVCICAK